MADCVKVRLMRKLAEVLAAVPGIDSVARHQGTSIDLDTVRKPALYLYDELETRGKRNRLATGEIDLHVMVWFDLTPAGESSFPDVADNMQAAIHNALIGTAELRGLVEKIEEVSVDKPYANDLYGALVMRFKLTYCHAWGDAFTVAY
jgi:hypothetical protein